MRSSVLVISLLGAWACGGKSIGAADTKPAKTPAQACSKTFGVCYDKDELDEPPSEGDDEIRWVCEQHCTHYGVCHDELNPEQPFRGGGSCTDGCMSSLKDASARADQVKILKCQRSKKDDCKAVMDCG